MQTRRDQLQAYRFQNRRALAALVTGEPNVVEPPMRRLTVDDDLRHHDRDPGRRRLRAARLDQARAPATAGRQAGAVIVERETGATYVMLGDGMLHPVLNYASAVLAVGPAARQAHIGHSSTAPTSTDAPRGVDDRHPPACPTRCPAKSELVTSPWTVCSRLKAGRPATSVVDARSPSGGDDGGARRCRPGRPSSCARRRTAPATCSSPARGCRSPRRWSRRRCTWGRADASRSARRSSTASPPAPRCARRGCRARASRRTQRRGHAGRSGSWCRTPATGGNSRSCMRDGVAAGERRPGAAAAHRARSAGGAAAATRRHHRETCSLDHESAHRRPAAAQPSSPGCRRSCPRPSPPRPAAGRRRVRGLPRRVDDAGLRGAARRAAPSFASGTPTETARSAGGQADEVVLPAGGAAGASGHAARPRRSSSSPLPGGSSRSPVTAC